MKKITFIIIVVILISLGIWYARNRKQVTVKPNTTATYSNSTNGINFTYPKILTVSTKTGITTVQHSVPFVHHDYCDFKGEGTTTIPTLTDFHLAIHITNKDIVDTIKLESSYIPAENFVHGNVIPSPGIIDQVQFGNLKGYKIFGGAEGCGHTIYYFSIASNKTLVAVQDFITIFSGAIDAKEGVKALLVPGVISKGRESEILSSILTSVQVK